VPNRDRRSWTRRTGPVDRPNPRWTAPRKPASLNSRSSAVASTASLATSAMESSWAASARNPASASAGRLGGGTGSARQATRSATTPTAFRVTEPPTIPHLPAPAAVAHVMTSGHDTRARRRSSIGGGKGCVNGTSSRGCWIGEWGGAIS
jgi:hypothetical protein